MVCDILISNSNNETLLVYRQSTIQLPVTDFDHFSLESLSLEEDEKRRLLHVRRISLTEHTASTPCPSTAA